MNTDFSKAVSLPWALNSEKFTEPLQFLQELNVHESTGSGRPPC